MNAIVVPRAPAAEIIEPGTGIFLLVATHVFSTSADRHYVAAGLSLSEIVAEAHRLHPECANALFAVAVNGDYVPAEFYPFVRPKPGTTVLLRAVAEFGGDNTLLRSVLGLGVAVAGLYLGPILFPSWALGASLAGAAITIGGQLLINALLPVAPPKLDSRKGSRTYSIAGGSNDVDPYGVIPVILGEHRVYPKKAALAYTETIGDKQYLHELLCVGYGPLDISDVKIGETPIEDFEGVEIETREGYVGDDPITLYPNEVVQDDVSLTVTTVYQSRTTAIDADVISLEFVAPSGLGRIDSNGGSHAYTVDIRVEYSPAGAGTWSLLDTVSFRSRKTDLIRKGVRLAVASGQYDVRVKKTSSDYTGSDQVQETVIWSVLRISRNDPPIEFPQPLALIGLRILASSQLNGSIDQLNCVAKSKVTSWNGAAWVADTLSSNPGDHIRHVLQGAANARPAADAKINLTQLAAFADHCTDEGFTCNIVLDEESSVLDTLKTIAACGRGAIRFSDGLWSVFWDDPDAPIAQHFTPRNSSGFSGARAYRNFPHAWRVRFVNAAKGWAQDEMIVYADGYTAETATLFEGIQHPGQTSSDLNWRHTRFHDAQARLRPEIYRLSCDLEHLVAERGDRVRVSHDVILVGLGAGRVLDVIDNGITQTIVLDEPVTMEAATDYGIRFRLPSGESLIRDVVLNDGEQSEVVLVGIGDVPAVGDLFMFGERGTESGVYRIRSVSHGDELTANLTLVDDAPEIADADTGAIPAFSSNVTVPSDLRTASPINLTLREAFSGVDGDKDSGAVFAWEISAGQFPISIDVQYRDDDGDEVWRDGGTAMDPTTRAVFLTDVEDGEWSFRVRSNFEGGFASAWSELMHQSLLGVGGVPLDDIANFRMSYQDNTSVLTWDEITDFRDVRYELRKGDSWAAAQNMGTVAHPPFTTYGDATYWVAAVSTPLPGVTVYSTNPTSLLVAGATLVANVVATHDEQADGWLGTITGPGTIDSGNLKSTASGETIYYEVPSGDFFDVLYARPTRLSTIWKSTGEPATQNILDDPDFLNNPDILGVESARFVESWVEISISQGGSTDVFDTGSVPDVFAPADIFAGSVGFSDWTKFAPGVYVGRYFKFRLAFRSNDAAVNAVVQAFTISADVPDRLDRITGYVLDAAGETFTFQPVGSATPVAFQGGPDGATEPLVLVSVRDEVAGDRIVKSSLTLDDVFIQVTNGGVGVSRTIDVFIQGW